MQLKKKLYADFKNNKCPNTLIKYKKIKNKINNNIKSLKNKFYKNVLKSNNQQDNWKMINKIIKKMHQYFT